MNLDDIELVAPGVSDLSQNEHEALQRFTLLWSLFEAQKLDERASVRKISEKIDLLDVELDWFKEQLDYFKNRYIDEGNSNHHYDNLHLRPNDNPKRVLSVLKGENSDAKDQLITCLTIVYRFRNNFFHGVKWAYGIKGQLNNFTHAATLLKNCLVKL
ncbi:hypothetical protein FHG08_11785 [Pseudoalteromonas sp. Scap03]|uniref:hypothetical protein n=1 Tax=unclassified Pseudoalteromonas TaxID=194690 RepID=UPI0015BD7B6E|nr:MULTISPECIES: hypothetical protein [unclassified Pseudoalteromonas]NWL16372.1 hypothetical protein [Pseudoalteromonas sp. Scap03]QLE81488.1 hypothetical protein FLM54_08040 [Pseudoalteromonas sp. Scap25]QLE89432.1 hypothetical protein FLM47_08035 [Pseudoalteromonas sp. Scap06]